MSKKRIAVVCPGRGSYTAETLGYLKKYRNPHGTFLAAIDDWRREGGDPSVMELDGKEKFSPSLHTKGEHASVLIYACAACDLMSIDPEQYEIVAVTGNSMGWYLAAAFAGALDPAAAYQVIQTMGGMMRQEIVGGQVIYPVVDDRWHSDPVKERAVEQAMVTIRDRKIGDIYLSIKLGGYAVVGGDKAALAEFMKLVPKAGDYPFQLLNHAAFHTPLMYETSRRAFELLPERLFKKPKIPLIDGRGVIWQPYSTDAAALHEYTLGHQVYAPYDFTSAISVTLKEFAPDALYLLGPGSSLSGAIGQIMVSLNWRGISDKEGFKASAKDQMILADPRK